MFVQRRDMGEKFRDLLRYLPQEFGYTPGFTAKDFMLYIASIRGYSLSMQRENKRIIKSD